MKGKRNKCVINRKKQSKTKNKSQNTKKKPVNAKSKKPVSDSKKRVRSSRKPTAAMKSRVKRDSNGHILPGSGSNGGGRPVGSTSTARVEELKASISRVELERIPVETGKGKSRSKTKARGKWLDHQIRKSYEDTSLAIAILSRLYPALKAVEQVSFAADSMEEAEAAAIRKALRERFEAKPRKEKKTQ